MSLADEAIRTVLDKQGLPLSAVQPGDIGCAHSTGILGWLIRFGTRSTWNHSFVVVDVPASPTPETITVVQAEAHGVELAKLSDVAPGGTYAILPCPVGVDRAIVVREARALLREKYAFISIASIALKIIATALHIPFRLAIRDQSTLTCSAVVALSLFNGGWSMNVPDLYQCTPAEIAILVGGAAATASRKVG